ncbi:hypothetical protein [Bernardetia sp. MNP-M8]|uniref:hypothetical protein n=1 Tax=Bernardetia sp. MNP-M8 TaxID=3127470 RepID=UPI0030D49260
MNYFLDTNVVLIYLRDNIIARQIEADLQILQPKNNLLISVVTLGELKSIAKQNN